MGEKIRGSLASFREAPQYDNEQTQEIVLVVVGAVDHEGKHNHKTLHDVQPFF